MALVQAARKLQFQRTLNDQQDQLNKNTRSNTLNQKNWKRMVPVIILNKGKSRMRMESEMSPSKVPKLIDNKRIYLEVSSPQHKENTRFC